MIITDDKDKIIKAYKKEQVEYTNKFIDMQEEIERLNKEIKEYQEELEKADSITQSCIFEGKKEATKSYRECLNLLERLHSIIKEVREYINKIPTQPVIRVFKKELLEILEKVNNNEDN